MTSAVESRSGSRLQAGLSNLVGRPLFWVVIVGCIASAALMRAVVADVPRPPPILAQLPAFELTDQDGDPFGSEDLVGRVWIANFVFTRCPTVCPVFSHKMGALQDRIRHATPHMHLVSFSVDPEYDTPEVMRAYAARHGANHRMWTWLTGTWESVRATVKDGMKISMENEGMLADDVPDILHGTHFVLVDRKLRIRGYYDSNDAKAIEQMLQDAKSLLNVRESR